MIPWWLLVVAVLGVNFTLWGTIGLLRALTSRGRADTQPPTRLTVDDVAVLMAAHNEELVITDSLGSVAKLLPRGNIHVVSDGSKDRTVELARLQGVNVIETPSNIGKAGALEEGIRRFGLVEKYGAVLLLDADTRLEADYFEHSLPLFDDDRVVAVAGCATSDWSTPPRTTLGALLVTHRARVYALTQRLLKFGQTWRPTNATFIVPGFASMYRTRALPSIKIDQPGLVIEDFNMTFEVYRQRLGKVGFSLSAQAATQDPDTFDDYLKQTRRWALGFWQSVRRHRPRFDLFSAMLTLYVLEVLVSSLLLVVAPVLLVLVLLPEVIPELANWGVSAVISEYVNARSLLLGVLLPDLVLTVGVALAERRARYLLFAPFYLPMRVIDAVTALRTLPRAWLEHSTGRWVSPARRKLDQPGARGAAVPKLGAVLAGVAALAVALRVWLVSPTLPASSAEQRLIDSVFASLRDLPGGSTGITELQLQGYLSLTRALERYDSVLLAARELAVVATGVAALSAVALLVFGLRMRLAAVGIAVLLLAFSGPSVVVLASAGTGALAMAWTTLACALLAPGLQRKDGFLLTLGGVAALAAVLTAPILIIPPLVVCALRTRWYLAVPLAGLAVVLQVVLAGRMPVAVAEALTGQQRVVLLATAFLVAVPALLRKEIRLLAAGVLVIAGQSAWLGETGDVLLPALVVLSVTLLAGLLDAVRRPALLTHAIVVVVLVAVAGTLFVPRTGRWQDEAALAGWIAENTPPTTVLTASAGVWSELLRAGLPPDRVRRDGPATFDVVQGSGSGAVVARFGGYTVQYRDRPSVEDLVVRLNAGRQLAANPRLLVTDDVRRALHDGQVDLRAMTLLAGLSADHEIVVADVRTTKPEQGLGMPRREVVLSAVDGRGVDYPASRQVLTMWLNAQQAPFAPSSTRITPQGAVITWLVQEES
ncbi:glycosyltransferase family 2 protein [Lentzea waywayandensis]|uniref:glycosyltransferase family 2 protein n=1 Tax=Lentzea waywayandensis TaxID=84724 RepID=UPI001C433A49|nr:glycosyltransferase family 2 protein [Lentzea waywayandensis]